MWVLLKNVVERRGEEDLKSKVFWCNLDVTLEEYTSLQMRLSEKKVYWKRLPLRNLFVWNIGCPSLLKVYSEDV
jgi:hypothetical protein